MKLTSDPTPAGVLFDVLKRHGGITHRELAGLILSGRPLADGRSPLDRAEDRTWVSHCIVHAPVGTLQERYFADYGSAAARVADRLKAGPGRTVAADGVIDLLCGRHGRAMDRALAACHQDAHLYRNALERLAHEDGKSPDERAEAALALFIAVACSTNVRKAVTYATDFAERAYGGRPATPPVEELLSDIAAGSCGLGEKVRALGLLRLEGGYVAGDPHWLAPEGCEVGALAMGDHDITDVGPGASAHHLRIWREEPASGTPCWLADDLGSTNGTVLVSGSDGTRHALVPGYPAELHPADQLLLGSETTLAVIEGLVDPES